MKSWVVGIICLFALLSLDVTGAEEDFYKGNYAPDADYILSGGLIKDLPPAIEVPVNYKGEGFAADRLSAVPAPGVHPRVIMSPSDIERMKKMVAMGDKAPRFFRIQLEQLKRDKDWKVPQNYAYWNNPFGQDGKIAGWGLLAMLTDDQELGRKAAEATVEHALFMEPRLDILNTCEEAKDFKDVSYDLVRTGLKFGPYTYIEAYYNGGKTNIDRLVEEYGIELAHTGDHTGAYYGLGWEYDYAYNFMTEEEREIVRRVISKATFGKYDTGMSIPGQMYINNHMSSGANWIPLALAIEGEKGYDERILPIATWSLKNKLTYDLSSDGLTYENTKGFIPMLAVLSVARRQGADDPENLLKHSHLNARAYSNVQHSRKLYNRYIGRHRYREGTPQLWEVKTGMDEDRFWRASGGSGSGGHYEFWYVLKHFYPDNEMVDFVYNAKNSDFNAELYEGKPDERYISRLHYSWFQLPALCMLTAEPDTDYNKLDELKQFEALPKFWFDSERGMVSMRNGWGENSMLVHMENRIDQYYSGHETPQHGDFQVWADGIPWSPNLGAYRDASYRAMVTVDGLAGVYCPVSGDWMTATNTPDAATSVAEMTTSYQWRKLSKLLHLDHPALEQVPLKMGGFSEQAYTLDRFTELPYLPRIKEHYDGFAHLDYGPWHGETRGAERYGKWNDPMDHVFRTIHFARGDKPYLLVIDDLEKDGMKHQYDWRMPVIGDSYVYSLNPAPQNRHLELNTEGVIGTDIVLTLANEDVKRDRAPAWGTVYPKMQPKPKKGDPMLLVRVLWRNTNYPYPVPNVQRYWEYNMISVPAYSESPEYRILIFPHRFGDDLPVTSWSDDRGQLTIKVGGNVDVYEFDQTDDKRTVFNMTRNGKEIINSDANPPKPMLKENSKWTVDQNRPEWRQNRLVVDKYVARFAPSAPGAEIRYTLDGAEPNASSPIYNEGVTIDKTCVLKARTYQPDWRCGGSGWSDTSSFAFEKQKPAPAVTLSDKLDSGLVVRGYEIKTTIFDKKGFFQGSKSSLPNMSEYKPLVSVVSDSFDIPSMEPTMDRKMMAKGFYTFEGYLNVPETGVYYFEVESCGPVDFKIGDRQVILVNQQYGLSYKKRYGEVALEKGKHPLYLLVCDTMYWKGDIEEKYTINVSVMQSGENEYKAVNKEALSCMIPKGVKYAESASAADLKVHKSVKADVVSGLIQERYDRIAMSPARIPADGLPLKFFDTKGQKPYAVGIVDRMQASDTTRKLLVYRGYVRIVRDGLYAFKLKQGKANCGQLKIAGQVVARQRVAAPAVSNEIKLARGLHKLEFQVALGNAVITMRGPGDDEYQLLGASALARPKSSDKLGKGSLSLDSGLVAYLPCETLEGGLTEVEFGKDATATVQAGVLEEGKKGKAIGFYEEASRISLRNLATHEDAVTVACWVKLKENSDFFVITGVPYMTEEYDFKFRGNHLVAEFKRGIGVVSANINREDVEPGKWFHVVATFGDENAIYFNGEFIASTQVMNKNMRRGSGRAPDVELMVRRGSPTNAAMDEFRLYDRILSPEEIKELYEIDK